MIDFNVLPHETGKAMPDIWKAVADGFKEGAAEGAKKAAWKGTLAVLVFGQLIFFCWIAKAFWPDGPEEKLLVASLLAATLGLVEMEFIYRAFAGEPFAFDPSDKRTLTFLLVGFGLAWALALFLFIAALR